MKHTSNVLSDLQCVYFKAYIFRSNLSCPNICIFTVRSSIFQVHTEPLTDKLFQEQIQNCEVVENLEPKL